MLLVASGTALLRVDPRRGTVRRLDADGSVRPTCTATDPRTPGRAWCGTRSHGLLRSDDAGKSWRSVSLAWAHITAVTLDSTRPDTVWVGTEPSALWHSDDAGATWAERPGLLELSSSGEWSFPPKPDTHHVRWIGCHPERAGHLWVAIEAGALLATPDGGRTWRDRVPGGPYDTHELAVHPDRPDTLRISAGDGYYESDDAGETWRSPEDGLEVGYLRSVAIDPGDPDVVVVSAASRARSAYVADESDGRLYRRAGRGAWTRIVDGWPDPPVTIAPLLCPGRAHGELWAADERGVHRSGDGGVRWKKVAAFDRAPSHLRGLAVFVAEA